MKSLMTIAMMTVVFTSTALADVLVAPVNATAQSGYVGSGGADVRLARHAIDGSGLSVPLSAASSHSLVYNKGMWLSDNTTRTWIAFDMGREMTLTGMHVWNYNEATDGYGDYFLRGVKSCEVYAGKSMPPDGMDYDKAGPAWGSLVGGYKLLCAPGTLPYRGEDVMFAKPVVARYVMIYVKSNHGLDSYTGLSEVRFYAKDSAAAKATPEPVRPAAKGAVAASGKVAVVDNGAILREVDLSGGHVRSSAYVLQGTGHNVLSAGSREFSLLVDGKLLTGQSAWKNPRVERSDKADGESTTTLSFDSQDGSLALSLAYTARSGMPLVSKTLEVRNTGKKDVRVESVNVEDFARSTRVWGSHLYTHSHIYRRYARFRAIGPYVGDWEDPLVAVHDASKLRQCGMVIGNETPSVLKRIGVFEDGKSLRVGTTTPDAPYPFRRWLKPGEKWRSAAVFTAPYVGELSPERTIEGPVADHVRSFAAITAPERGLRPMFLYSSWEPFYANIDEKLVLSLAEAAAECGVTDFLPDWATHANKRPGARGGLEFGFGDYVVDTNKFPHGLEPVVKRVRELGMNPVLYFCLAQVTRGSEVSKNHPEWLVQNAKGRISNVHMIGSGDFTGCFATGWKDYIGDIISRNAKGFNLSYLKLDLSIVTSAYVYDNLLSGCYAKNHPGHRDHAESLDAIYAGCMEMFDRVHRDSPRTLIDCTFESVGRLQLIDYGILRHADANWLSNIGEFMTGRNPRRLNTLPCRMRQIAWERSLAVPASSMVIGNLWIDNPNRILAFKSLAGALPMMLGDPRKLSKAERAEFKRLVDAFREAGERHGFMAYRQDLPGFGEPGEGRWDGFARINTSTRSGGIVGVFRQNAAEASRVVTVKWLDPKARYSVTRLEDGTPVAVATGAELERIGFRVTFDKMIDGELYEISAQQF